MLLLTARILPSGTFPVYDATKKNATVVLADGRSVLVEVQEVAVAFEIEEVKK